MTDPAASPTAGKAPAAPVIGEPQEERGAPGSRGPGSDQPEGGPVDRPAGTSDAGTDTTVDPQGAQHADAPDLPTGDQAG
jgi:hypothetical protein